jgi:hypothetical protein
MPGELLGKDSNEIYTSTQIDFVLNCPGFRPLSFPIKCDSEGKREILGVTIGIISIWLN